MTAGAREPENPLDLNFKISFRFHFGIDELGEFLFFASNYAAKFTYFRNGSKNGS